MSDLKDDIAKAARSVAKDWKREKRKANRYDRVSRRSIQRVRMYAPPRVTIRQAAFDAIPEAYKKASSNGKYYANARQIMYAARPKVLELTDGRLWKSDKYFTQTLLKDYIQIHGGLKVVWDARGHLKEPHTDHEIGLGGGWRKGISRGMEERRLFGI